MAISRVKIFGYDFTFVFRHRYEKNDESLKLIDRFSIWKDWKLGFFFRRYKVVGRKNFNKPKEWNNNLVYEYMIGIDLLICKTWFTVSKGAMDSEIKDN
jgi:hypothetical protein